MPDSCSSTNSAGIGTPEAIAISSTTLRSRRSDRSVVSSAPGTPPSWVATASPPARSDATRYIDPSPITAMVAMLAKAKVPGDGGASSVPHASQTATSTASTMPTTARPNSTSSRVETRRACAWRSKKFTSELDLRRRADGRLLVGRDLEQRGLPEAEVVGDQAGREHLAPVVVGHDAVVERLPRERDLVLRARQLLGQLHHVL